MTEFPSGPSTHAGTAEEQLAPSLHRLPGGGHVAYRFLPGHAPTVVFLCGYVSEMTGTKARFLHRVCAEAGHACLRFLRDADLARLARTLRGVLGGRGA